MDNECPQVDSGKFQSVKVYIIFHKTLDETPKVDAEGESLNNCSDFYVWQQVLQNHFILQT